jgi:hypothetical protein
MFQIKTIKFLELSPDKQKDEVNNFLGIDPAAMVIMGCPSGPGIDKNWT